MTRSARALILAAVLIAGRAGAQSGPESGGPPAASAVERARQALDARKLDQALALVGPVLADPEAPPAIRVEALFLRSRVNATRGKLAESERDWKEVLALSPGFEPEPSSLSKKALTRFHAVRAGLVGTVRIDVEPTDAQVLVDGQPVPAGQVVALLAGAHVLTASRDGFDSAEQQLEVEADRLAEVRLELLPNSGAIVIRTVPEGVVVRLDGEPAGITAAAAAPEGDEHPATAGELELQGLELGEHRIEFEKPCYRMKTLQVLVQADLLDRSVRRIGPVVLDPLSATLQLRGGPVQASVLVDGAVVGVLPLAPLSRCPGPAAIEVRSGERVLWSQIAELDPDADVTLEVRPRPNLLVFGKTERTEPPAKLGAAFGVKAAGELPAGTRPETAEGWREVALAPDTDLVAVLRPDEGGGAAPRWLLFSPVLGTVEPLDPALDPARPRWRGGDLGLEAADSRVGGTARVVRVRPGGPADRAGIAIGERIVEVSGQAIASVRALRETIDAAPEPAPLVLRVEGLSGASRQVRAVPELRARALALEASRGTQAVAAAWARVDAVTSSGDDAAGALANLARLLSRAGRHAEAAAAWGAVEALGSAAVCPGAVAYHRGVELDAIGRAAEAAESFRGAAASTCSGFGAAEALVAPAAGSSTAR